jgi:hypothetical protein
MRVAERPDLLAGRGAATAGMTLGFVWMILATLAVSALVFDAWSDLP